MSTRAARCTGRAAPPARVRARDGRRRAPLGEGRRTTCTGALLCAPSTLGAGGLVKGMRLLPASAVRAEWLVGSSDSPASRSTGARAARCPY
eukprot:7387665-Prymnesium_polylepis.2